MELLMSNETFNTKAGNSYISSLKSAKYIGLYFSESFCPLSRYLTPLLAEIYEHLNYKDKNIEIVLISNDINSGEYDKSLKDMPWIALPFDSQGIKDELIAQYKVVGMPRLIILSNAGKLISSMEQNEIEEHIYDPWMIFYQWERVNAYEKDTEYTSKNHPHKLKLVNDNDMKGFDCIGCTTSYPEYQPRMTCPQCEVAVCCHCFTEDELQINTQSP